MACWSAQSVFFKEARNLTKQAHQTRRLYGKMLKCVTALQIIIDPTMYTVILGKIPHTYFSIFLSFPQMCKYLMKILNFQFLLESSVLRSLGFRVLFLYRLSRAVSILYLKSSSDMDCVKYALQDVSPISQWVSLSLIHI